MYSASGGSALDLQVTQKKSHPPKRVCRSSPVIWHNRPTTPVTALYPELLSMIFGYLEVPEKGRVAQVCHSWKEASYNKSVWRDVNAKLHLKKSNPTLFQSLVQRGIKRIQILSFQKNLKDVTHFVPNLDSLVLSGCFNLTDDRLASTFAVDVHSLSELNLSMCKQLTDKSITRIVSYLKNLESLDIGGCGNITNASLEAVVRSLRRLRRLNLRSCRNITDTGIAVLCGQDPDEHEPSGFAEFAGDHEKSVARLPEMGATSLEYLGLQDCQKLTDDALKYISAGLKNLKSINLSFCGSITEFGLKHLSTMTELRELNLRSSDVVTDQGLRYLSEGCLQLHVLDVSFCDKIGDAGLTFVAQGLPAITSLSLNSCAITDASLVKIAQSLTDLKTLNIGQCNRLTDTAVIAIADHCQNLTEIDLYGCPLVTTAGLERLHNMPLLNSPNLVLWPRLAAPAPITASPKPPPAHILRHDVSQYHEPHYLSQAQLHHHPHPQHLTIHQIMAGQAAWSLPVSHYAPVQMVNCSYR